MAVGRRVLKVCVNSLTRTNPDCCSSCIIIISQLDGHCSTQRRLACEILAYWDFANKALEGIMFILSVELNTTCLMGLIKPQIQL